MGTLPDGRRIERAWHAGSRWARSTVLGGAVLFALLGALFGPPEQLLVWAPLMGLGAAGMAVLAGPFVAGGPSRRRVVLRTGVAGFLLVPSATGLGVLGPAGGVLLVVLLVLGAVWLVEAAATAPDPVAADGARQEVARLRRVVGDLPVEALLQEWRHSSRRLTPDVEPEVRVAVAEVRRLLLEELTRRDPAGVERWLRSGRGDPGDHLPGAAGRTV